MVARSVFVCLLIPVTFVASCANQQPSCADPEVQAMAKQAMLRVQVNSDPLGMVDWSSGAASIGDIVTNGADQYKTLCSANIDVTGRARRGAEKILLDNYGSDHLTMRYRVEFDVSRTSEGKTFIKIAKISGRN